MNKLLKILATTAAIASILPLRTKTDENGGTAEALLWKATWTKDPSGEKDTDVNINLGFNNIFRKDEEAELFADELVVDYCCDSTLVHDCGVSEPEDANADAPADHACGECDCFEEGVCQCGEDCACQEKTSPENEE